MSKDMQKMLSRLQRIEVEIRILQKRMGKLETIATIKDSLPITAENFLKLPDSLRKTMITMVKLKEVSAESVARETGRTRGLESMYLNQLVRMGYLYKVKRGREIHFRTRPIP